MQKVQCSNIQIEQCVELAQGAERFLMYDTLYALLNFLRHLNESENGHHSCPFVLASTGTHFKGLTVVLTGG